MEAFVNKGVGQRTKVKICGLYRREDVDAVNAAKPDYIGFIIGFPKSHRNVTIEQVAQYKQVLDPRIQAVGVFVNASYEEIVAAANYLDVIQLHGEEDNHFIEQLRKCLPQIEIWKAFKVRGVHDLEHAVDSIADRVVLDNGYGTGNVFDWSLLRHLTHVEKSFILAGGLDVSNLADAIRLFHPYALDISSGVETNRCKDRNKIIEVVTKTREMKIRVGE